MKLKKQIALYSSALLFIFLLWLGGLIYFAETLIKEPHSIPEKKLDAIVVLTGGSNRIYEGFNLLDNNIAEKLFISGVYKGTDAKQLLDRWKKEEQKNLDCCIVLGFEAENTIENVKETKEWLKKENYKSIYLVTSNYHMRRSLLEFKKLLPDIEIYPYPIIPENVNMHRWWEDKNNLRIIIKEYNKYIAASVISFLLN